jgi:hypothetical protein
MIEVEEKFEKNRIAFYIKGTKILHREGGPATKYHDGSEEWFFKGLLHRVDGPAVEYHSRSKEWWIFGNLHREDGPAIERADGRKEWWFDGLRHREDGPAILDSAGNTKWYLEGMLLSKEEWLERIPEDKKMKAFFCEFFMSHDFK